MQSYLSPFGQFFLLLFSFCLQITFGIIAAYFANKKGRHVLLWFLLGMFFGILGILLLLLLPPNSKDNITLKDLPLQNRDILSKYGEDQPPQFPNSEEMWFYGSSATAQSGPLPIADLVQALKAEPSLDSILVWKKGMDAWEKASLFPEIMLRFKEDK